MNCQIGADEDNYDPAEIFDEEIRTARKEYKCCECNSVIQKGQKYQYVHGMWGGEWSTFKTCIPCATIRKQIFCSWTYGYLWSDLIQYMADSTPWDEVFDPNDVLPESMKLKTTKDGD